MNEIVEDTLINEEDTQINKYLTFGIEKDEFGIEIKFVREIIGMHPISDIPEMPDFIRGIINLRGQIIPIMDMRSRFKKITKDYNDRTCIVVVEIQDFLLGLVVDKVLEVINITEQDLVLTPEYKGGPRNDYIKRIAKVEGSVKLILDCEKLLKEDEMEAIEGL